MMYPRNCKHYSYPPGGKGPACALGVDIRKHVGGPSFGWMARTPCVTTSFSKDQAPCDLREYPTTDELAEQEREFKQAIERVLAGRSSCCDKPMITQGTARFCSKCKEFVARMCPARDDEP